jgi:DNA-binding NarL/FixJ family response regulator
VKIIIADDHPLFAEGLKTMIGESGNMEVVAIAGNGRALIDCVHQHQAEMVLMDLNMPGMDGVDTLRILKKDFPSVKVLVLTSYFQPELIREIKLLGADGYMLKNSTITQLKEAIESVASGNTWFTAETNATLSDSSYFLDDFMKKYQLTRREVEIIRLIGAGFTTKEIGDKLFVSEFTINAHRRNISRKLNIHTPVGLLNFAKEQGLI